MKRILILLFCIGFLAVGSGGCAVYMAAHQPGKKNVEILKPGISRAQLIAEFGQPASTSNNNGHKTDIFRFVQGYSKGAKAGRAIFHGAADVFTLGLWEVFGTPTEMIFDGKQVAYQVAYDLEDKVIEVIEVTEVKSPDQKK
jgi:hypothetical protein